MRLVGLLKALALAWLDGAPGGPSISQAGVSSVPTMHSEILREFPRFPDSRSEEENSLDVVRIASEDLASYQIPFLNKVSGQGSMQTLILFGLLLSSADLAVGGGGPRPGRSIDSSARDRLLQETQMIWESIECLKFHCRVAIDEEPGTYVDHDCAVTSDLRFATQVRFIKEDGVTKMEKVTYHTEYRIDGNKKYVIDYLQHDPTVASRVSIRAQDRDVVRRNFMNEVYWLFLPGGEPIYRLVAKASRIDFSVDGKTATVSAAVAGAKTYQCTLDQDHDWLPVKATLTFKGSEDRYTVDRFALVNGHWLPVQGTLESTRGRERVTRRFEVSKVSINRACDPAEFGMPSALEEGVAISDKTRKGGGRVIGGFMGRQRFHSRYPFIGKPSTAGQPLVAPRDPVQLPWSQILVGTSLLIFTVAIFFKVASLAAKH